MFKKSTWPGIAAASFAVAVILTWMQDADSRIPQAVHSTPSASRAFAQATLPTETWRIVLPTATLRPTAIVVTATPLPTPTINLYGTAPCGCSYDAYDCSDFKDALGNVSVDGAQLCFNYCLEKTGTDPHHLISDVPWDAYINTAWVCTNGEIRFEDGD
jgi:hypothetical protein